MAFGSKVKKAKFKFDLGSVVRDGITGFEGVVTGRTQWVHNCNTYCVKSQKLKDDKPMDAQHFDEPQLELVKSAVVKPKRDTGGPTDTPQRTNR